MSRFKLSSQGVLLALAVLVAGGMYLLNVFLLQPLLAQQENHTLGRRADAVQQAAQAQLKVELTQLAAHCRLLARTTLPAGLVAGADGFWLCAPDGQVKNLSWFDAPSPTAAAIERSLGALDAPAGDIESGLLRVGEETMLVARHETGPAGRLYLARRLGPALLGQLGASAPCRLLLVRPDSIPDGALGAATGGLAYWPVRQDRLAVVWPARDLGGRTVACFRADVPVAEIRHESAAVRSAVTDVLVASFGIVVLVILASIVLLANPITRLLRRVQKIGVEAAAEEDLTRHLHAEPLALAKSLRLAFQSIMRVSKTDEMTALANRRHFDQEIESAYREAVRYRRKLAVVALDIDRFKAVNDSAGHQAGDEVIRSIGRTIKACCREVDLPARTGGDEFVILMPETSAAGAAVVAERMRQAIAARPVPFNDSEIKVTVSLGVADTDSGPMEAWEDLTALADKGLYRAKERGGNRVEQAYDVVETALTRYAPEGERTGVLREWLAGIDTQFRALCVRSLQEFVCTVERRDPFMANHARKVRHYALLIAERMNLSAPAVERIGLAALLHDIGMVALPDSIILSGDRLSPEQAAAMRRHPLVGARILEGADFLESALPVVKSHHERFDGTGYPDGLTGQSIPLAARIVAVADAFDAMTSPRAFRRPVSLAAALADLQSSSGAQFDPDVVTAFLAEAQRLGESIKDVPVPKAAAEETPAAQTVGVE